MATARSPSKNSSAPSTTCYRSAQPDTCGTAGRCADAPAAARRADLARRALPSVRVEGRFTEMARPVRFDPRGVSAGSRHRSLPASTANPCRKFLVSRHAFAGRCQLGTGRRMRWRFRRHLACWRAACLRPTVAMPSCDVSGCYRLRRTAESHLPFLVKRLVNHRQGWFVSAAYKELLV
jgi:hypothetical protein